MIEALLTSTAVVALAEVGDKTMLLAIVLAARLRAPWQILGGIFAATIANHALAALVGREVAGLIDAPWFRIAVALGFIAMAAWTLVPDKLGDEEDFTQRGSAFLTTLVAFFLVEMGDKTQVATIALAAQYNHGHDDRQWPCGVSGRGTGQAYFAQNHADCSGPAVPCAGPVAIGIGVEIVLTITDSA